MIRRRVASCREVGRTLQSYLDGEVDEGTHRRIHEHLDDCRRCGLEAQTYRQIKAVLAQGEVALDPGTMARLRSFGEQLVTGDEPSH